MLTAEQRRSGRNAERAERRRNVRLLHGEGLSVRAIARRLGVGVATVHRDLVAIGARSIPPANLPAAPEGNQRATTHGLTSSRSAAVVEPRARELVPGIVEVHGHLDERRDGPAVLRYAMVLARLEAAYGWLAEQASREGGDDLFADREAGKLHGLLGRVAMWEKQAGAEEERLAISPRERTRLKLDKLGLARGLVNGNGERVDLSGLDDDELETYRALHAKIAAVDGDAEAVTS